MPFRSKNMHYCFNSEYFEGKDLIHLAGDKIFEEDNKNLVRFTFAKNKKDKADNPFIDMKEYHMFLLETTYPGLLIGTGNMHDLSCESAVKIGFSFDYVTGLPYISGSAVKGLLRNCFPKEHRDAAQNQEYQDLICDILKKELLDVTALANDIFNNNDVFLDSYPMLEAAGTLLELDYITPHTAGKFKNPNPISLVKVKPEVLFQFSFLLHDYKDEAGEVIVSADEKEKLFKALLLMFGAGAKTNVGFGHFVDSAKTAAINSGIVLTEQEKAEITNGTPVCKKCGVRPVQRNLETFEWGTYCSQCRAELKAARATANAKTPEEIEREKIAKREAQKARKAEEKARKAAKKLESQKNKS